MRKSLAIFIVIACSALSSPAELYRLEGTPFQPTTNVEIVWNVAISNLPKNLWIYKVIPQNFSLTVLSNILNLGGFQIKNNTASPELRKDIDKNFIQIEINSKKSDSYLLNMAPTLGWVSYHHSPPANWKWPIENVPRTNAVKSLALEYLGLLGIDRSQISSTPPRGTITTTQRGSDAEKVSECGAFLVRRIDGLDELGSCFYANFGSNSNLLSFELNWRNLLPYELHKVATINEMTDFIKGGRTTIPRADVDKDALSKAKKLTVTTFFPLYFNCIGYKPIDFEYPFAAMDIVADVGNSNTISFTIYCPILSTNLIKP